MIRRTSITKTARKIVVVFDITSSTRILENLLYNEKQTHWRDLLIHLKTFITNQSENFDFDIYKFIGDGWILLFPEDFDGFEIIDFLYELSDKFKKRYITVEKHLNIKVNNVGLTFGIDKGTLIYLTMNGLREYIGKPINVATRLQGAIIDKDKYPQNKVLISKNTYSDFSAKAQKDISNKFNVSDESRKLKNILKEEDFWCVKVSLLS